MRAASGVSAQASVDPAHWQQLLGALAHVHQVPGATLGILRGDDLAFAHHGILNAQTGVTTTDDSVFQIGSITKVWTATAAMRLVDDGRLELDTPIVRYLPEFRASDPEVTTRVTMRHLLTHTSGIDGDVFTDTGRGDDCLQKYIAELSGVAQNHPLGHTLSYCNAGFVLAGRVIEAITGSTWDDAMRDLLFTPLGLTHTSTLPEDAIRFRTAAGHTTITEAGPQLGPAWMLPRSSGPAALINASAADVLAFARLHLTGGLARDGHRLMSEAAVHAMQEHAADMPDQYTLGDSWGLGWIRFVWDGRRVIGHDGSVIGQAAFLRIVPELDLAVVLLTNGGDGGGLFTALARELFAELAGMSLPREFAPPAKPVAVEIEPYLGVYDRAGQRVEVFAHGGGLRLRLTRSGELAKVLPDPVQIHDLVAVQQDVFALRPEGQHSWQPVVFYTLPTGEPYLHYGGRAAPKVA